MSTPSTPKRPKLDVRDLPEESISEEQDNGSSSASLIAAEEQVVENWTHLRFTHAGKEYAVELADSDRVFDLKEKLQALTSVPFERQKILGLVKGKLPADDVTILDLKLPPTKKFQLIGTPEGQELKELSEMDMPDVFNDWDIDLSGNPALQAAFINDRRNVRKIREAATKLNVNMMSPLRPGKKLLVLDIDYTIVDTIPLTSGALPPSECARPGLHDFMEAIYPYYDIVIWSQTSWIWLETKLVELGMVGSDRSYKIAFVLDKTSMFTVFSTPESNTRKQKHSVKALKIIWTRFPQFGPANTVHVDDLGRNFALNPGEGVKVHAFKDCHTTASMQDTELPKLGRYLVHLGANVLDFRTVKHKNWRKAADSLPQPPPPAP
ncbi:hypothetical protein FRB98_009322 [Tulasnella sp. 332]|nr:hypothetical protein FRB98_009322 [Tulasnella sp. 332]